MSDIIYRALSCIRLTPNWARPFVGIMTLLFMIATSPIWVPIVIGNGIFIAFFGDVND